jgi:hypothetical protein
METQRKIGKISGDKVMYDYHVSAGINIGVRGLHVGIDQNATTGMARNTGIQKQFWNWGLRRWKR